MSTPPCAAWKRSPGLHCSGPPPGESRLQGHERGQRGHGEAQTDTAGTPHAVERGSQPHGARTSHCTHPAPSYQGLSAALGALRPPRVHAAPQGIRHRHTTTSPPRAQPGHGLLHPQQPGKVPAAPRLRAPAGSELAEEPPSSREHPGEDEKQHEGQGSRAAGDGSVLCKTRRPGAHPRMNPASPSPALSPPGVTQDKTDPDEPHRALGLRAGRCQGCGQHSPGGGCLGRTGSGRPQDRHLLKAARATGDHCPATLRPPRGRLRQPGPPRRTVTQQLSHG